METVNPITWIVIAGVVIAALLIWFFIARSRTNRLASKREASQMLPGRRARLRGTLLELSCLEISPEQVRSYPISSIVSTIASDVHCILLFASPFDCVSGLA